MLQCSACGEPLEEGEIFCSNCGKKQEPLEQQFKTERDVPDPPVTSPPPAVSLKPPVDLTSSVISELQSFQVSWDFGRSGILVDGFVNPFHFKVKSLSSAKNLCLKLQLFSGQVYEQTISSIRPGQSRKVAVTIPDNQLKPAYGMQCDLFFSYEDQESGKWFGFQSQDIFVDVVSANVVSDQININMGDINIGSGNTADRAADSETNVNVGNLDVLGQLGDLTSPNALIEKLRSRGSEWCPLNFFEISEDEFPEMSGAKPEPIATELKQVTLEYRGQLLHVLTGDSWRFGRSTDNEICLRKKIDGMSKDDYVRINRRFSSTHFVVEYKDSQFRLQDGTVIDGKRSPSTNGIKLDGFKVDSAPLAEKGHITMAPASVKSDELGVNFTKVGPSAYVFDVPEMPQLGKFLLVAHEARVGQINGFGDLVLRIVMRESGLAIYQADQPISDLSSLRNSGITIDEYKQVFP